MLKPTKFQLRSMIGVALKTLILTVMKNHMYTFKNVNKLQIEGGATGLDLTGELADLIMLWWDMEFMKVLKDLSLKIDLYGRFKDDGNLIVEELPEGTMYSHEYNELIFLGNDWNMPKGEKYRSLEEIYKEKCKRNNEKNTMNILVEIANKIEPMIQFTADVPSNHSDGYLPVLDIKVRLDEENEVIFDYYEKDTKSDKVILASSALSWHQKREIHTNELVRRLRNTSQKLGEKVQNDHLNKYMIRLKDCGYNARFRANTVERAKKIYQNQLENDRLGVKPLFRNRKEILHDRQKKKGSIHRWWNKPTDKFNTVIFVPPTPGGELLSRLKKREAEISGKSGMRIKFIERGAIKLKHRLSKADPFPSAECSKSLCPLCKKTPFSEPNRPGKFWTKCNTLSVGYRIICKNCQASGKLSSYEGETGRPGRVRLIEHVNGLRKKNSESALQKHQNLHHPSEQPKFEFKITKVFSDPLTRQANEAVRISNLPPESLINAKSEFHHPPINRLQIQHSNPSSSRPQH